MGELTYDFERTAHLISESGRTIYDPIDSGDSSLWLPRKALEAILNSKLIGFSVHGLPNRTRSKVVKEIICSSLGYPVPKSFKKTQPRFPGQNFDTYVQKSNNLQIWNEELDASRRYVLIRVSSADIIEKIRVVDGAVLAKLDTTGTLTQKYQARYSQGAKSAELVSLEDTDRVQTVLCESSGLMGASGSPIAPPNRSTLIPIEGLITRLASIVGTTFTDAGHDQERLRGASLHRVLCDILGYEDYVDDGTFPDIPAQLLEVKLQTSSTIDLGLVTPNSRDEIDLPRVGGAKIRHCDVRYAIAGATTDGVTVTVDRIVIVTGKDFFTRFPRCEGKVLNKKLQIPLPSDFFGA